MNPPRPAPGPPEGAHDPPLPPRAPKRTHEEVDEEDGHEEGSNDQASVRLRPALPALPSLFRFFSPLFPLFLLELPPMVCAAPRRPALLSLRWRFPYGAPGGVRARANPSSAQAALASLAPHSILFNVPRLGRAL